MLSAWAQSSRTLASTSTARAAPLHTSAVLQAASARARKTRTTLKENVERREQLRRTAEQNRPHVVLGHRQGDEAKWQRSDLARVLLTEQEIRAAPQPGWDGDSAQVRLATHHNYGIGESERELLFSVLPSLTAEGYVRTQDHTDDPEKVQGYAQRGEGRELFKSVQMARLVDLRNANARGIAYENRRRIVAAFSEPENPNDTGRPEVQAALFTLQIRNLWDHLSRCKKDIANRRNLRQLIHKRAKILKYLKRVDEDRYDRVLHRLGLEPGAVEGELVV